MTILPRLQPLRWCHSCPLLHLPNMKHCLRALTPLKLKNSSRIQVHTKRVTMHIVNIPDVVATQMLGCMLHQEQERKLHDLVQDLHPTSALVGEAAKADVQEVLPGRLQSHFHGWTDVDDLATNPYHHHQLLCPVLSDPANWKQDCPHTATQVTQLLEMFHTKGLIRLCLDIVTETHISKFNSLLDSPNLLVRRTHIHTLSACGKPSPFFHCILLSFLPW